MSKAKLPAKSPTESSKGELPNDRLKESLDEAEWIWLKSHVQRDAVIVVSQSLTLLEVGSAVASDSSQLVERWIQSGLLAKPTAEQIYSWDLTPSKRFMSMVLQPYVFIQEIVLH